MCARSPRLGERPYPRGGGGASLQLGAAVPRRTSSDRDHLLPRRERHFPFVRGTQRALAKKFGVSEATISRDLVRIFAKHTRDRRSRSVEQSHSTRMECSRSRRATKDCVAGTACLVDQVGTPHVSTWVTREELGQAHVGGDFTCRTGEVSAQPELLAESCKADLIVVARSAHPYLNRMPFQDCRPLTRGHAEPSIDARDCCARPRSSSQQTG